MSRKALLPCTIALAAVIPGLQAEDSPGESEALAVPYGFYNENFGAAVAYAYGKVGAPQPQASMMGTVMAGTNESVMGFGMLHNFLIPGTERLFMDIAASAGTFGDIESYTNGNPLFPNQRAGSNDSHPQNFINGNGVDFLANARFRYLLREPVAAPRGTRGPAAAPLSSSSPSTASRKSKPGGATPSWRPTALN